MYRIRYEKLSIVDGGGVGKLVTQISRVQNRPLLNKLLPEKVRWRHFFDVDDISVIVQPLWCIDCYSNTEVLVSTRVKLLYYCLLNDVKSLLDNCTMLI